MSTDPPIDTAPPHPRVAAAHTFVAAITAECADRGSRAALRTGLGKPVDAATRMHRIVAPHLPSWTLHDPERQRPYYTIAALIAASNHQDISTAADPSAEIDPVADTDSRDDSSAGAFVQSGRGNLGSSLAHSVNLGGTQGLKPSAAETRLTLLTRQGVEGLHRRLPATIRQLARTVPIDFVRLLLDLQDWPRYRARVIRHWLQSYYRLRHQYEHDQARAHDDAIDDAQATTDA